MTTDELAALWGAIEPPIAAGMLSGRGVIEAPAGDRAMLAVDHSGLRHLLIPVSDVEAPPKRPATKGLKVDVDVLKVGEDAARRYLDIACRDAAMHGNFVAVALEVIRALEDDATQPAKTVEQILNRWRWFWGSPPAGLSDEGIVGLFGELWYLEFWLAPVTPHVMDAWRGPFADRHDFKWPSASTEVKATRVRTDGSAKHRITALDQLEDPDQGILHLFSLRVTPDPIGAHSLETSIDRVRRSLKADTDLLRAFEERIGRAGYTPAHQSRYGEPMRVVSEELYVVRDDFPRLTRESFATGVPGGVGDITYTLDLGACQAWRIATRPSDESVRTLRASLDAH